MLLYRSLPRWWWQWWSWLLWRGCRCWTAGGQWRGSLSSTHLRFDGTWPQAADLWGPASEISAPAGRLRHPAVPSGVNPCHCLPPQETLDFALHRRRGNNTISKNLHMTLLQVDVKTDVIGTLPWTSGRFIKSLGSGRSPTRRPRIWRTRTRIQQGTGGRWAELHRLVMRMVSSRLPIIRLRHRARKTSVWKTKKYHSHFQMFVNLFFSQFSRLFLPVLGLCTSFVNAYVKTRLRRWTSGECVDCRYCVLTYERQRVARAGEQVIGVEQEEGVAQDEGHLEEGAHGAFGRKQKAEEVHHDEEAAGDQQVDHVDGRMASKGDLNQ